MLVIYLFALSSSPCPSLSSLYGKELYSPCSLALAIWIGSSRKEHNGRGLEGRKRRKGLVLPSHFYIFSVISHLVSWLCAPRSQLWTRILSMILAAVREPLCPGSSNTPSSYSLLLLRMTMASCCCSPLDCLAIPSLTFLLYQNLFTNSLY